MNTWIWHYVSTDGDLLTYRHGRKIFTFPQRLLAARPKFITDADVAHLKAAIRARPQRNPTAAHQTH